jgi:hypothetical protein
MRFFLLLSSFLLAYTSAAGSPDKLSIRAVLIAGENQKIDSVYLINEDKKTLTIWLDAAPRNAFNSFQYRIESEKDTIYEQTDSLMFSVSSLPVGNNSIYITGTKKSGEKITLSPIHYHIKKMWYRATWFWALCLFMLLGAFFGSEKFLKKFEEEDEKNQRKIAGLEMRTLQLQMNPHFVFNALNSIQSFIIENDPLKANDHLSKFSRLIRMFLESSRARFITIGEEVQLLRLYCEVEKLRFESKFDFEIIVNENLDKNLEIPTMILQPFLENSINHGLRYKKTSGFLKVEFTDDQFSIICKVSDDGIGRKRAEKLNSPDKPGYKSQGLAITTERIATLNKVSDTKLRFQIEDLYSKKVTDDVGTLVTVTFPKQFD